MSYDLRGQWLFTGKRLSGKRAGDLCKLTQQKAMANHCHILPCIIMVVFVNSRKDNNVKDPKGGVSFRRDHHVLQVMPDRYPATVCRNSKFNKNIAIWNVRTMYQSGKIDYTLVEMRR